MDFLEDLLNNKLGSAKGWKAAISGMIGQVKRKESSFSAMVEFLTKSAIGKTYPYKGGLLARVYGTKMVDQQLQSEELLNQVKIPI